MQTLAKQMYRAIRFNPVVERTTNSLRRSATLNFDAIDLFVPISPGDIVIDGGANVGLVTSKAVRAGATVHAFEPNSVCFDILRKRFALHPNVHLHNKGLMDRDCTLTLSTPVAHREFDSIDTTVAASFVAESFDAPVTTETVTCIDISEFIMSLDKPVAVLKLDIEGAEIGAINRLIDTGAIDRIKFAVVETHERFSDELARQTEELKARLAELGLNDKVRLDWI
ncbi:FkbM family methyltransferase [Blastomonas sp.]|uniref:FkbM family methyltransferase n=1 Tax=Blastomonas sp. TaxID=1909299 RepID=UPI003593F8D9